MKKYFTILIFLILFLNQIIFAQYFYTNTGGDYQDRPNREIITKINVFTGENEFIVDLVDSTNLYKHIDDSGSKLFADYYNIMGYKMVDLNDPSQIIDLSQDRGNLEWDGYYRCAYHHLTNKLYLEWSKTDTTLGPYPKHFSSHAAVVDPITGENIREYEPFFDLGSATFSADGQKLYAMKNWTNEEVQNKEYYLLIINTENEEIIEQIPTTSIFSAPFAIPSSYQNLILVHYYGELHSYLFVYNLDSKEKSKTFQYGRGAMGVLYNDGKNLVFADSDSTGTHTGDIWIHDVIWPDDGEIIPMEAGEFVKLPSGEDIQYRHMNHPLLKVHSNQSVILYQHEYGADKYLIRIKDAKLIRINHRPVAQTFSVFATNSIWLKDSVNVKSGYVGVNDLSSGPFLNANVQLSIDNYAKTAKIEEVFANSIKVKNNAVVKGNVYTNSLVNNGKVKGTINNPFTFPVLNELPTFESATLNTNNIIVKKYKKITLEPGNYGDLLVKEGGKVVFTGGTYNFKSIELKKYAKLRFATQSEVRVAEKLSTKPEVIIAPKTTSDIKASDIVFYIAGINGANGGLDENPKAAKIGKNSEVKANLYVPNGTLYIKADSKAKGAFWAKDVIIGERTVVNIKSAWELEF